MNLLLPTCAPLLLLAAAFAQAPAARPQLHIPAGDWSVRDLLTQAEQALRTPIVADDEELAQASAPRVQLQFPLALDPEHGRDALAALLTTRGLLLTRDPKGRTEVKAVPRGRADWLAERAVPTTVQALLDHPHRDSIVKVPLQTATPMEVVRNLLRMTAPRSGPAPTLEAHDGGILCTGTSDAVRHAVLQLAAMDPAFAATLAPNAASDLVYATKGGAVELAAGEYLLADLVQLLGRQSGVNIVLSPAVQEQTAKVRVAGAQHLDARTGANVLTTLLWQERVLVLDLDVRHGLYEAVLVADPRQMPAPARASTRTVEEALAAADGVAYIAVKFTAQHLDPTQLMGIVRETMQAAPPGQMGTIVSTVPDGLWITGLSPTVAPLLAKLRAADEARRG